jgi:hypothetical protein
MFILCRPTKNEPRKRTKGLNAPWDPAARKVAALSLRSFFRQNRHLQLLRLQVKGICKHESNTRIAKTKSFALG